jgi:hypothetical protein
VNLETGKVAASPIAAEAAPEDALVRLLVCLAVNNLSTCTFAVDLGNVVLEGPGRLVGLATLCAVVRRRPRVDRQMLPQLGVREEQLSAAVDGAWQHFAHDAFTVESIRVLGQSSSRVKCAGAFGALVWRPAAQFRET